MKHSTLSILRYLSLFVGILLITIATSSCNKTNVRKEIDGTWEVESYTLDKKVPDNYVSGVWVFESCSKRKSKDQECPLTIETTVSVGSGESVIIGDHFYGMVNGDDQIQIGELLYDVNWQTDRMVLVGKDFTTNEVIKLKRV